MRPKAPWRSAILSLLFLGLSTVANAEVIYIIGDNNLLLSYNHTSPDLIVTSVAITGLNAGELIRGIDFRPGNAQLYALGSTGRVYTINTSSGVATPVGSGPISPNLSGTNVGFDFNPTADRIRVVTDLRENIRLNPDTGAVAAVDTLLTYATGDVNASQTPAVDAVAYTNSIAFSPSTTLYGVDSELNVLVRHGSLNSSPISPNSGTLFTVGGLGVNVGIDTNLDISSATGTAYMTIRSSLGTSDLYTVDLSTGAAERRGTFTGTIEVLGMAVAQDVVTYTIPVIGSATGQNNTSFRGDLTLTNSSAFATTVKIDFFEAGITPRTVPTASTDLTLNSGEQRVLADVLKTLFNRDPGVGALRITTSRPISVLGRIYNQTAQGTFGQFIRGADEADRRTSGVLPGLKVAPAQGNSGFRTNIGWFNPNTNTVTATFIARGPDGTTIIGTAVREIPALTQSQVGLGDLFPGLTPGSDLYVTFTITGTPVANLFAYASVIDNATGDAIYIPAFRNN